MISHAFETSDKVIYTWSKGLLFYKIEMTNTETNKVLIILRIPIWQKNAEWITINATRGLEWGRVFR